jgi:hypothetical protein
VRVGEKTLMNRQPLCLALALAACVALPPLAGCKKDVPTAAGADGSTTAPSGVVSVTITPPGASSVARLPNTTLNKFFPKDGDDGYTRIFSANGDGLAEAKLEKGGKEVAGLYILDATRMAFARAKFAESKEQLDGLPVLEGVAQSSVLVKDRYLVRVSSMTLDHTARKAILAKFDLKGLGGT